MASYNSEAPVLDAYEAVVSALAANVLLLYSA